MAEESGTAVLGEVVQAVAGFDLELAPQAGFAQT